MFLGVEKPLNKVNGLLVVAKSALKLFEAMEALLYNDDLIERMGQRSRSICEERFDGRALIKSY